MHRKALALFTLLAVSSSAESAPLFGFLFRPRSAPLARETSNAPGSGFVKQNGLDAQTQNEQFASIKATDSCQDGSDACVEGGFAQCVGGKWQVQQCSGGLQCFALPLVNSPGVSLACDTPDDAAARISTAINGPNANIANSSNTPPPPLASTPSSSNSPTPTTSSGPSDDDTDDDCDDDDDTSSGLTSTGDDSSEGNSDADDECTDDDDSPVPSSVPTTSTLANQAVPPSVTGTLSASQQQPAPTSYAAQGGSKYPRQAMVLVSASSSDASGYPLPSAVFGLPSLTSAIPSSSIVITSSPGTATAIPSGNTPPGPIIASQPMTITILPPNVPAVGATVTVTVTATSISTVTVGGVSPTLPTSVTATQTSATSSTVIDPGVTNLSTGFITLNPAQLTATNVPVVSSASASSSGIFGLPFPSPSSAPVISSPTPAVPNSPTTPAPTATPGVELPASVLEQLTATI